MKDPNVGEGIPAEQDELLPEELLLPEEIDILTRLTGFPINVPAMITILNIWRASQRIRLKMEREVLSKYGLSWNGFSLLYNLWIWGPMETRHLAKSMGLTRATVSSLVNTLEGKGLCKREVESRDRRLMRIVLTPSGERVMETLYPRFNEGESRIVQGLSDHQLGSLNRMLRRIILNLGPI
ncbi:MarR family winged helix-turn-helix transcriptional regulator [Kyrpidia spormannii]|uniref:Uncharacterized HTH-type transcriptional regulator YwaE n=2 Tax=Kyrpidia spormannii TaxID=2055160 RepID=A0ACA8ZD34_9BACL|nr:MarR family transcriptional regulator [Kyrpidia spormannii]CAB3394644.1 Uncharacterized HTH-type transcriptional regulator YwaE [Kyrpidia spormannii]CAB3395616.1 Uncharacterized HTH-type transcriptional regulator YwaE [Kyrpidia spormannii]